MDETKDNTTLEEETSVNEDEDVIHADNDVIEDDDDGHDIEQIDVPETNKGKSAKLIIIAVCCLLIVGLSAVCIKQYTDRKETEKVITMIDQLVKADNINQSLLKEINAEYNELSENQKSHVTNYQDMLNYIGTKETQAVIDKIAQLGQADKFNRPLLDEIEAAYNELSSEQKKNVSNYQDWADYVNYHNAKYKYIAAAKNMVDQCDKNMEYITDLTGSGAIMVPALISDLSNDDIESNYKFFYDNLSDAYVNEYLGENYVTVSNDIMLTYSFYKSIYDMINNFEYNKLSFTLYYSSYKSSEQSAEDALNNLLLEYTT